MARTKNIEDITLDSVGKMGRIVITGTDAIIPPIGYLIFCILPSTDFTFTTYTNSASYVEQGTLTDIELHSMGIPIYGEFISVTPASGTAIGYLTAILD